jgi:hypothetical protein
MKWLRRMTAGLGILAIVPLASTLDAQVATTRKWWVDGAFGVTFPVGEYANATDPGVTFGTTVGYNFRPRWSVLGSFKLGLIQGQGGEGSDANIYSYFLKAAYNIGGPGSRWRILIPLGAGGATFDPEDFESKTYFALNSGLMFQWYFDPRLAFTFEGFVTLVFRGEDDIGGDTVWLIPLAAGMHVRF